MKRSGGQSALPSGAIRVNHQKLRSKSWSPDPFKDYYVDLRIICKDCGTEEIWTARQQQWWYEVAQGDIETTAVRCRACRRAKRDRAAKMKQGAQKARLARARKLASDRPETLDLLRKPLQEIHLRERVEKALLAQGILTVGSLVACDPGECPAQMSSSDWEDLKRTLKGFGIPLVGLPVIPP